MSQVKVERAFGRDYVADDRDYEMPLVASSRRFRRWHTGRSQDQGSVPSCVGHAWYHWLDASPIRQRPMKPDGIYTLAQYFDEWVGTDYGGTSVRAGAKVLRITGHVKEYAFTTDVNVVVNWLLERGPVVLGIPWKLGMDEIDRYGWLHNEGPLLGGHAILACGVNVDDGFVNLKNSYGVRWGNVGHGKLGIGDLQELLNEFGEACTATEVGVGQSWPF